MPGVAGNRTSDPLITSLTPNQLSYFVVTMFDYFILIISEINECAPLPCGDMGFCRNMLGYYECICNPGWTGVNCSEGKTTAWACYNLNPSSAETTLVQSTGRQRFLKTILTLPCWYSLDSSHRVPICQGFSNFSVFLHHLYLTNLPKVA